MQAKRSEWGATEPAWEEPAPAEPRVIYTAPLPPLDIDHDTEPLPF